MIQHELTQPVYDDLFKTVLKLKTLEECKKFFRDLCTIAELEAMAERWKVVRLLDQGVSYRDISNRTGASTATVTRVAHWLNHGTGGYPIALKQPRH